jgi:hypothetical protein
MAPTDPLEIFVNRWRERLPTILETLGRARRLQTAQERWQAA